MEVSRSTFLSHWAADLQQWYPGAALPAGGEAHGALSAHLLSKDDSTVFGQFAFSLAQSV